MNSMHVILGNQLFPIKYIKQIKPEIVFMKEDFGLCTYEKHHKHKIILFLSATVFLSLLVVFLSVELVLASVAALASFVLFFNLLFAFSRGNYN